MAIIYGNSLGNFLVGSSVDDWINGYAGNDTLHGRFGDDTLYGGDGGDSFDGGPGADYIHGGNGYDTAWYDTSPEGVRVSLAYASFAGLFEGGDAEGDTLISIERVYGSKFGDVITASDANTTLYGLEGDDALIGRNGFDTVHGGDGNDTIAGGRGDDSLLGGAGNDYLQGDDGFDIIRAGAGDDTIMGSRGTDLIMGGAGEDTVSYVFSREGIDVMVNRASGLEAAPQVITEDDDVNTGGLAQYDALSGVEHLIGSNHDDTLTGDTGNNRLEGRGGNDEIDGGRGDDTIDGGAGDDDLRGGTGDDLFVFDLDEGFGTDIIRDFDALRSDKIVIGGLPPELDSVAELMDHAEFLRRGVLLDFGDDALYILGVDAAQLSNDDFILI